jgi:hypothetical protein
VTTADTLLVARARHHGILVPVRGLTAARKNSLEFATLCAVLMRETSGGRNVFGHDPTICVGWGSVTHAKYLRYLHLRALTRKYQGVGSLQLTWGGFQDQADRVGGCWRVYPNLLVGSGILHGLIRQHGLVGGLSAWNGSRAYGVSVAASVTHWRHYLSGARTLTTADAEQTGGLVGWGDDEESLRRVGVKHVGPDDFDKSVLASTEQ